MSTGQLIIDDPMGDAPTTKPTFPIWENNNHRNEAITRLQELKYMKRTPQVDAEGLQLVNTIKIMDSATVVVTMPVRQKIFEQVVRRLVRQEKESEV